jgi:EmrB/QacA subfamily drug resistance transporter
MTEAPVREHYNATFAVLALAAATYALLQSFVAPALLTIQHDLHTSTTGSAWILTSYLLAASVATPIAGRLGDMFGKKRILVIVLALSAVGLVVSALATTVTVMILGRVVQGAGGAIFPLSFGIIRDEFPRERVAHGIGVISGMIGIGGGLGIVLAGPVVEHLDYHWLFWLPLVAAAAATVGTLLWVPESPVKPGGRVDYVGAFLLSGWLVALLVGISEGADWGWTSARVLGLFVVAAALFVLWVWTELRIAIPLIDMKTMRYRPVWTTNAAALVLGFGMLASFVLVPQFVQMPTSTGYGFGASVTQAGLFLLPSTISMMAGSMMAGRLAATAGGSRVPLVLGALITALAFLLLAVAHGQEWLIYLETFLLGLGIGFAYAAMANLIVESVASHQTGAATGMNAILRIIGGAIGAQVSAAILTASITASGLPTERGFVIAFGVAAGACAVGLVVALLVPRPALARARAVAEAG